MSESFFAEVFSPNLYPPKLLGINVDILKDCYGVPSISHRYMMQTKSEKLYTPTKEVFELLKKGMTGGCCQVFTKYHKVDETEIKNHKIEKPKTCKKIVGYDANSLYLGALSMEMPCGRPEIIKDVNTNEIIQDILDDKFFGFVEVDIHTPKHLKEKVSEFPPLFIVSEVPDNLIPNHIKQIGEKTGRTNAGNKLLAVTSAEKILLYTPLIKFYT